MNNFKCLGRDIYCENEKKTFKKQAKCCQILGILNNNFTLTFAQKSFTTFYMEAKFGPSDERMKATDIN